MTPRVTQYLNKTILVSIPALFDDGACRAYKLHGAEVHGLWLQSEELTRRLASDDTEGCESLDPVVFVPFAQIAGVMIATRLPEPPESDARPSSAPGPRSRSQAEPPSSAEGRVKRKK
jgi:hypothetical protein